MSSGSSSSSSSSSSSHVLLVGCRLRASPAGLVGMHENVFLSDFFSCVSRYFKLARDRLSSAPSPVNAERATAWAILAYLYDFCGNTDKFQESLLNQAAERGSSGVLPVGFAEMFHHKKTVKVCCGEVDTDEVESFCAQVQAPPKLNDAATGPEMYPLVMKSYRTLEQAVYGAAFCRGGTNPCGEGLEDVELGDEGEQATSQLRKPSFEVSDTAILRLKEQRGQFDRLE
eukprot:g4591.t1